MRNFNGMILSLLFIVFTAGVPADLHALTSEEILQRMKVTEKLDTVIPMDLTFSDQNGGRVRLGDYFTGQPVILTLNFYECPMLCPLVFRNLVQTVGQMQGISLSRDFRIVTVSFNPDETPATTKQAASDTHAMLRGVADQDRRWPFLMGDAAAIRRLTDSVGFNYVQLGKNNFAHPTVLVMLTPQGKVARYLYGMEQNPRDLKLALIEAADGKIGTSQVLNQALLYCFHYDPAGRKYSLAAMNIMKVAGAAVLLFLIVLMFSLWRHEKVAARRDGEG